MEKSKPSEEEIITLGKKIVNELHLESGVNTLGRWMSHYVAELIEQSENCKIESEKKTKQKECCEVILELWKNREHIPDNSTPMSDLEPLIELLDALKKEDFTYPYWGHFRDVGDDSTWKKFLDTVKSRSENIFELCIHSSINKDLIEQKQDWIKNHRNSLSKEELKLLEHLSNLMNRSSSLFYDTNEKDGVKKFEELSTTEKYEAIFNKIEFELEDMSKNFKILKDHILEK